MSLILVGSDLGCRVFDDSNEIESELTGHQVCALGAEAGGSCIAVVNQTEIWRRNPAGVWSHFATAEIALQSVVSVGGHLFAGGMAEATLFRFDTQGNAKRLQGFEKTEGRSEWFAGGPPLGVRSLAATCDDAHLLAAVHVGGIPISSDGGETWTPTIPVLFDVHEVRAHRSLPNVVAAAASVGLCLSKDGGRTWTVHGEDFEDLTSLAVAVLENEILFSVQDGPFASRSQVWSCNLQGEGIEQMRDGLPEWLDGKVDTNGIATGKGRTAIVDGGGTLWLSTEGTTDWRPIAHRLPYVTAIAVI